ncbi:MAG: Ku protein, partial [Acidobacteria bacterium]|nr:Ku protein [Acidobacteriota bacterium]
EEIIAPAEEAPPKVVDLMEALRKSLEQVSGGKKKAAKVAAGRGTMRKRKVS